jgi:hypothetical protein
MSHSFGERVGYYLFDLPGHINQVRKAKGINRRRTRLGMDKLNSERYAKEQLSRLMDEYRNTLRMKGFKLNTEECGTPYHNYDLAKLKCRMDDGPTRYTCCDNHRHQHGDDRSPLHPARQIERWLKEHK